MLDTDLITHDVAAFNIFLIGEMLGIEVPVNEKQTEIFLTAIKERIKAQQKQIKNVKEFKAALDNLRYL